METQPAGDPTGTAAKILSMLELAKELPDDTFTLEAAIVVTPFRKPRDCNLAKTCPKL